MTPAGTNVDRWLASLTPADRRTLLTTAQQHDPTGSLLGELLRVLSHDIHRLIMRGAGVSNVEQWVSRLSVGDRRVLLAAARRYDPGNGLIGELLTVVAVDIRTAILRDDRLLARIACREGLSDVGTWEP